MTPADPRSPAEPADDTFQTWDSQCWFPPLELAALVVAGVLPENVPVLDIGCGAGIEAIFLAKLGWPVYAIDKERTLIDKAASLAKRYRASPEFRLMDVMWGASALPAGWPRRYGIVLDRLCVNNVVHGGVAEADYYATIASFLEPGGLYILRDRGDEDEPEGTFRRRLFDTDADTTLPEGADAHFELMPGGRVLDVRLVGDDTPDWNRTDAMVPIRGLLAVLRKRRERQR